MAEEGSITVQIRLALDRLAQDTKNGFQNIQGFLERAEARAEVAGQQMGQNLSSGFTNYFKGNSEIEQELNKKFNSIVAGLGGIETKMGKLADGFARSFAKPIIASALKIGSALNSMFGIFVVVIEVVKKIAAVVKMVAGAVKEHNIKVKEAAAVTAILKGNTADADAALRNYTRATDSAKEANERLRKSNQDIIASYMEYKRALEAVNLARKQGRLSGTDALKAEKEAIDADIERNTELLANINTSLQIASHTPDLFTGKSEYDKLMGQASELQGNINIQTARADKLQNKIDLATNEDAKRTRIGSILEKAIVDMLAIEKEESEIGMSAETRLERELDVLLTKRQQLLDMKKEFSLQTVDRNTKNVIEKNWIEAYDEVKAFINGKKAALEQLQKKDSQDASGGEKPQTRQEKITAARDAAVERQRQAQQKAADDFNAMLIDEEGYVKAVNASLETQYAELENIVAAYQLTEGATIELRNETAALVKENRELADMSEKERQEMEAIKKLQDEQSAALKAVQAQMIDNDAQKEIDREKAKGHYETAKELELELLKAQRARMKAALADDAAFQAASIETRYAILEAFDETTDAMVDQAEKAGDEVTKGLFDDVEWQTGMQMAQEAVNAFANIADAFSQIRQAQIEDEVAHIDKLLNDELENIEKLRQQALEDAGFAEASTEESFEKQIEAAKAAGDEVLQYQLERRQEEQRINAQYDEQAKQKQKQAEYDKAKLQYDAELAAWHGQIAMLPFNTALMVMNAISSGWQAGTTMGGVMAPVMAATYGGMALAQGIAQGAVMEATKPTMPTFDSGGIVPGNSFNGDKVHALVNSGELILNKAQQDHVAAQLGGDGRPVEIRNVIYLGARVLAESVAEVFNDVGGMIETRAIRR